MSARSPILLLLALVLVGAAHLHCNQDTSVSVHTTGTQMGPNGEMGVSANALFTNLAPVLSTEPPGQGTFTIVSTFSDYGPGLLAMLTSPISTQTRALFRPAPGARSSVTLVARADGVEARTYIGVRDGISLQVYVTSLILKVREKTRISVSVSGTDAKAVRARNLESDGGQLGGVFGTLNPDGYIEPQIDYRAPLIPGTYHVEVSSVADPRAARTIEFQVVPE